MSYLRRWPRWRLYGVITTAIVLTLFILGCGDDGTRTPTTTTGDGDRGGRLRIALDSPREQAILNYKGGPSSIGIQGRPFAEDLLQTNRNTGEFEGTGLTTAWEMSPGGLQWTYTLRENIPFQDDWGDFTSKDVLHSMSLLLNPEAISTQHRIYTNIFGETVEDWNRQIDVSDDHEVVFNLISPFLTFDNETANLDGSTYMYSKAQWDAEGEAGYEAKPAGTGPWEFVEQVIQGHILFEAVDDHYRQTPEFDEFQFLWVEETQTRLAMLLTGETDMAVIDRDLFPSVRAGGMEIVGTKIPTINMNAWFYNFSEEGRTDPNPLENLKVRQAIAKAINKEEYMETLFGARGEPAYLAGMHETMEGFDPAWPGRYEDLYGYDPVRARELLAEAGYPEGFDIQVIASIHRTVPESALGPEVIAGYLQAVGINATPRIMEGGVRTALLLEKGLHDMVVSRVQIRLPTNRMIGLFYTDAGCCQLYRDSRIDALFQQYEASVNPVEREQLMRDIGNIRFDNFADVSMGWVPVTIAVNPDVVAEYSIPGNISAVWTHIEYIKWAGG